MGPRRGHGHPGGGGEATGASAAGAPRGSLHGGAGSRTRVPFPGRGPVSRRLRGRGPAATATGAGGGTARGTPGAPRGMSGGSRAGPHLRPCRCLGPHERPGARVAPGARCHPDHHVPTCARCPVPAPPYLRRRSRAPGAAVPDAAARALFTADVTTAGGGSGPPGTARDRPPPGRDPPGQRPGLGLNRAPGQPRPRGRTGGGRGTRCLWWGQSRCGG